MNTFDIDDFKINCDLEKERIQSNRFFFNKWKSFLNDQLNTCIKNNSKPCVITFQLYGPNDYSSHESEMMSFALKDFLTSLDLSGYKYEQQKIESKYIDAMDGTCTKCDKIITIQLSQI